MDKDVKFNYTNEMAKLLNTFLALKSTLKANLEGKESADIEEIKKELETYKNSFIAKFQKSNEKEIEEYLKSMEEKK